MLHDAFFVASKIGFALLAPSNWIIYGTAWALIAVLRGRLRAARWRIGLLLTALLAVAVLPVKEVVLAPLENAYPANPPLDHVDGIIVLGGGEAPAEAARWGVAQVNEAGDRFLSAITLSRRFPEARIVVSGRGQPVAQQEGAETGSLAGQIMLQAGLPASRLIVENRSRNTVENATFSHALVHPRPGETWVLLTSAFHMRRAMQDFSRAGWTGLVAWPTDYRTAGTRAGLGWKLVQNLLEIDVAAKEYLGLLTGWLKG